MSDIVVKIDWRAAAILAVALLVLAFLPHIHAAKKVETTIVLLKDPKCFLCQKEFNRIAGELIKRVPHARIEAVSLYSDNGRKLVKELNTSISPLILVEGNVLPIIRVVGSQNLLRLGKYFVIKPVWPVRRIALEGNDVNITIQAEYNFARIIGLTLMQRIPNAVIHVIPPDKNYIVVVSVPKSYEQVVSRVISGGTRLHMGNKVVFAVRRSPRVAVDVFMAGGINPLTVDIEGKMVAIKSAFGDSVRIIPHYVYASQLRGSRYCVDVNNTVCSPYGSLDALETMRELCIYDIYGDKAWLTFVNDIHKACRETNAVCITDVMKDMNMDVNAVASCVLKDGIEFARADTLLAKRLGIHLYPTVFIGAWYPVVGMAKAEEYVRAICAMLSAPPKICKKG